MEEQQEDKIYKFLRKRKVDESILSELKNQKVIMINVKCRLFLISAYWAY